MNYHITTPNICIQSKEQGHDNSIKIRKKNYIIP